MHGAMGGDYEIRVTGPRRTHYRLFCMQDNGSDAELAERGFVRPQIVILNRMSKRHRIEFSDRDYKKHVRDLGGERRPRRTHVWLTNTRAFLRGSRVSVAWWKESGCASHGDGFGHGRSGRTF